MSGVSFIASIGIRHAQMDVVKPQRHWILYEFEPSTPGILDEARLEEARDVAGCGDHLDTGRLEFLHLTVDVSHRKGHMIDHAAGTGQRLLGLGKGEDRPTEHNTIRRGASAVPSTRL